MHRDLKPANIFITAEASPRVLVLDFGIAKRTAAGELLRPMDIPARCV